MSLQWPVIGGGDLTSGIGQRWGRAHNGIDIAAPKGTGVLAPTDMTITVAKSLNGYGNAIYGVDDQGTQYRFGHLSSIGVRPGQTVEAGSVIGAVGSTGRSTGNHLHFEMRDAAGKVLDPLKKIGGAALSAAKDQLKDTGKKVLAGALRSVIGGSGTGALAAAGPPGMVAGAAIAVGNKLLGDKKSLIDELRDWIKETGFFQRIALAVFAFILIAGAVALMKGSDIAQIVKGK